MIRCFPLIATALCLSFVPGQATEPTSRKLPEPDASAAPIRWTGLYVGVHGSLAAGETGFSSLTRLNFPASWDMGGGALGIEAGYNYQINDVVLGVEADYALSGIEGSGQGGVLYFPGTPFQSEIRGRLNIGIEQMMMIRPRIGVAAGRSLVYVTAGAVAADVEVRLDTLVSSPFLGTQSDTTTRRNYFFGWTIGAGWEYAFTDNLSLKTEYLIVALDLDEQGNALEEDLFRGHFLRVGLNYHF